MNQNSGFILDGVYLQLGIYEQIKNVQIESTKTLSLYHGIFLFHH